MKKPISACLTILISTLATELAAEPVMNGDYVAVASLNGDRWHLAPLNIGDGTYLYLRLVPRSSTNAQVFLIEKVDLTTGPTIHDGDYVRLRGVNSDFNAGREPYLMAEGGGADRVNVNDKSPSLGMSDPTILFIRGINGDLTFGSPFRIRGTQKGDNWFATPTTSYRVGFTQTEADADTLVFEEPDAQMMRDDLHISRHPRSRGAGDIGDFLGSLFNRLSPNNERPPCGYLNSCNPKPPSAPPSPPSSNDPYRPTFVVEQPGSSLFVKITNEASGSYTCRLTGTYQWDSFGELQSRPLDEVIVVPPGWREHLAWQMGGPYVALHFSDPVHLSCA